MKALTEEKVVYHGELDQFIKFHNDNHESRIDSVVNLKQGKPTFWSLMLTKNSPLTPYFKKIAIESFQFGLRDALRSEWIGPDIKSVSSVKKNTLTGGQTFLLFVVLLIFMLLSTITFVIEVMMSRIWIKSSMYPQKGIFNALKKPIPIAWEGSPNPMKVFQAESGELLKQPKRQRQRDVPTQTKSSKISIKLSMSPKKTSKIPIPAWEEFPNPTKFFHFKSGEIQTKRQLGVDVSTQTESSRLPKCKSFHVI